MNYSRNELLNADAAINQLRNSIYHLVRFMSKNNINDKKERMQRIGKNISKTYIKYWSPIDLVDLNNIRDVIATIYKKVLKSSISVELDEKEKLIIVSDDNCALCKYKYDDIQIAGCEILLGLISEFINIININSRNKTILLVEPLKIQESKSYGNKNCIQMFKYKIEGGT